MNTAYKHLDTKLRIAELTVPQWIGVTLGLGIGITWGLYLSPLGRMLTIVTSIYFAALPVIAALSASFTDFDPWLVVRAAIAWRRREGRYIPGAGTSPSGYVVLEDPDPAAQRDTSVHLAELDLASLWEAS
jgi:hypothetical protein